MDSAAAVLDRADAGNYQAQSYVTLAVGVLPESVFLAHTLIRAAGKPRELRVPGGPRLRDDGVDGLLVLHQHVLQVRNGLDQRARAGLGALSVQRVLGACDARPDGIRPSALKDWFYTFAICGSLVTILVDTTWALTGRSSGMGAFYNCRSEGSNGTTYSSSAHGYARAVIDKAGQVGYLTAAD